jgi:TonB family protein
MTFFRSQFLVVTLILLPSMTLASKQETSAAALIEHAKQLSDIRAEGAPPFRLKLDFKIGRDDGTVIGGTYTEVWVSKTQWRKETVLGDFRKVQIASGRKLWLVDNATAPTEATDIAHVTDVGRLRPEAWGSRKDREINGVGVHCLENKVNSATWAVCFDRVIGTLYSEISPLHIGTGSAMKVCLHSDYQKFGEYMVARSYECQEDQHRKVQARVVDLTTYTSEDPTLFVQPEGAKESVNCLGSIKPPILVHRLDPTPPRSFSGTNVVTISVVVGSDGKPNDLRVISAPNRDYDEATLEAVQHWRYTPATCDGEPMEARINVETEFHHF